MLNFRADAHIAKRRAEEAVGQLMAETRRIELPS